MRFTVGTAVLVGSLWLACAEPPPQEATAPVQEPVAPVQEAPAPSTSIPTPEAPVAARPEPPWPSDMPSMLACAADDDCVVLGSSYPSSPCCGRTGQRAVAREWHARVIELRESGACEHVACAPLVRPSAASHGPAAPSCRPRCEAQSCTFVCE